MSEKEKKEAALAETLAKLEGREGWESAQGSPDNAFRVGTKIETDQNSKSAVIAQGITSQKTAVP